MIYKFIKIPEIESVMPEFRYRVLWADYTEPGTATADRGKPGAAKTFHQGYVIFLRPDGIHLDVVENPGEALKRIDEGDICLLLYHLSNLGAIGYDKVAKDELERIRKRIPELPVVGITASSGHDQKILLGSIRGAVELDSPLEIRRHYNLTDILYMPFGPAEILKYIPGYMPPEKE